MRYVKYLLCTTLLLVTIHSVRAMREPNGSHHQSIAMRSAMSDREKIWQEHQESFWKTYDVLTEISKTSSSIAQSWDKVEEYKETVYFPFFEQLGCERKYLEQRWQPLKSLFNTDTAFILIKKEEKPVAFFTVQVKENNALLYTSPCVLPIEQINKLLPLEIKKYYPNVTQGYHLVRRGAKELEISIKKLDWQQGAQCPIKPNKIFVTQIPYSIFHKTL